MKYQTRMWSTYTLKEKLMLISEFKKFIIVKKEKVLRSLVKKISH